MNIKDIPTSELELLANSDGLKAVFEDLERDAFEELMRVPIWAKQPDRMLMQSEPRARASASPFDRRKPGTCR